MLSFLAGGFATGVVEGLPRTTHVRARSVPSRGVPGGSGPERAAEGDPACRGKRRTKIDVIGLA